MKDSIFILLGATGDLAIKKIIPSLNNLMADGLIPDSVDIVTYSRQKAKDTKFKSIVGDFENLEPLENYINSKNYKKILLYFALPPFLYLDLINKFHTVLKNKNVKIALEKPFGTSYEDAWLLGKIIKKYGQNNFYLIDHYAVKESVLNFKDNRNLIMNAQIESVEISILENDNLEKRGAFFDRVGVVKDTVQNHILLLSRIILDKPINDKNFVIDKDKIILDQFKGYRDIQGVNPNSKTETYFSGEFIHNDIKFLISSAKGQDENNKYFKINFKNKDSYKALIDERKDTSRQSHELILKDFILGEDKYKVSVKEALDQWKIIKPIIDYSK